MTDNPLVLRELLQRDFGVDLPISGGGGSPADPIVITTDTVQQAVDVQMQVHRCLGMGRQVAWRLEDPSIGDPARKQVRAGLETVAFLEDQVRTNSEALYFVFEALRDGSSTADLPAPTGFIDPGCGLKLPYQLAWLHLGAVTDNESATPGLGRAVAYDGLGIIGTVYVYDLRERLLSEDVEAERVMTQFRQAVNDVLATNAGAKVTRQGVFRDSAQRGRCLMAVLDLSRNEVTMVLMTVRNGCFVKGRITFDASAPQFGRMAQDCVTAFLEAVRPEVGAGS